MSTDAEMKDAQPVADAKPQTVPSKEQDPAVVLFTDLHTAIELLEKAVSSKEVRFVSRALRLLGSIRPKLTAAVLRKAIDSPFPADHPTRSVLLSVLQDETMTDADDASNSSAPTLPAKSANLPEVEVFLHLLVLIYLVDSKQLGQAEVCGNALVKRMQLFNRRMADPLTAKAWYFYVRSYELTNRLLEVRPALMTAYRTATIHHNDACQAMLINLLLRNYIHYNQYELADKLVSQASFPETASNFQLARYNYYLGRLKSIQLDYTESHSCLMQAIRKAPSHGAKAFRAEVHKFLCCVQLLMGEIPDRDVFFQKGLARALHPYLQITRAVRLGNIGKFQSVMEQFRRVFESDHTYNLIVRLRQNVIKTALRNISLSYSHISLADVSTKLGLESVLDAEYVVAKAIADGVIEATINHETAAVESKEVVDVYSTQEPLSAFHKRIQFCLKVHNDSVKAMRYPESAHKGEVETAEERRARLADEAEYARQLAEEEDDGF